MNRITAAVHWSRLLHGKYERYIGTTDCEDEFQGFFHTFNIFFALLLTTLAKELMHAWSTFGATIEEATRLMT